MQYTTNYKFKKPEDNDVASNVDFNENFDNVDIELKRIAGETEKKLSKIEAAEKYEEKINLKEAAYKEISNVPTENDTKLITSGAVFTAFAGKSPLVHKHKKADITDFPTSMPASDVSAWAKAATKPSYNASEVGALGVNDKAKDSDKVDGLHFAVSTTVPTVDDKTIITFVY